MTNANSTKTKRTPANFPLRVLSETLAVVSRLGIDVEVEEISDGWPYL